MLWISKWIHQTCWSGDSFLWYLCVSVDPHSLGAHETPGTHLSPACSQSIVISILHLIHLAETLNLKWMMSWETEDHHRGAGSLLPSPAWLERSEASGAAHLWSQLIFWRQASPFSALDSFLPVTSLPSELGNNINLAPGVLQDAAVVLLLICCSLHASNAPHPLLHLFLLPLLTFNFLWFYFLSYVPPPVSRRFSCDVHSLKTSHLCHSPLLLFVFSILNRIFVSFRIK